MALLKNKTTKTLRLGSEHFGGITSSFVDKYRNISSVVKVTDYHIDMLARPANWLACCYFDGEPLRLYPPQISAVNANSTYVLGVKCRQVGWSTVVLAGRAVAKAHMFPGSMSIFVSYNLVEAKEKIKIARKVWDGVPSKWQERLIADNAQGLKFGNGSEILSLFSPRGFSNADIYLDEMAHIDDDMKAYKDAVPIITAQSDKQLFIGSTPLGKLGLFYDLFSRSGPGQKYSHFDKHIWFWWDFEKYCKDVPAARKSAHMLKTEDRVETFGTAALKTAFASMSIEDFQEEFEAYFCDEATAFFPYALIVKRMKYFSLSERQKILPKTLKDISPWCKGTLYAGFDVGRLRHVSELMVFDYRRGKTLSSNKFLQVHQKTFNKQPFRVQENYLRKFIEMYERDLGLLLIDSSKIGHQLAERLIESYPRKVVGVDFNNKSKEIMANTAKTFFEDEVVELWPEKELMKQIHSIKQIITPFGNTRYDSERNSKHHADKFWAIALACYGANQSPGITPSIILL